MSAYKFVFVLISLAIAEARLGYDKSSDHPIPLPRAFASPFNVDSEVDCALKELAWEFGRHLLPKRGQFKELYDALQLKTCGADPSPARSFPLRPTLPPEYLHRLEFKQAINIYVDANKGNDNNPGTIDQPLRTVHRAVELWRENITQSGTIYLREGTYFFENTLILGPQDSGLTITGYENEQAVLSGGRLYSFNWETYKNGSKIMMANLRDQYPNIFDTLFINGRRAVRARYPNGNPETTGLHTNPTGYVPNAEKWVPPLSYGAATTIDLDQPYRNSTYFQKFSLGVGGPASVYNPPESFWCIGGHDGNIYQVPQGLQYSENEGFANRTWKRPQTGVIHTFQCGYWGNWQFSIKDRDMTSRQITFEYGGFQEARGCAQGANWYVENIFEELDSPGEWYFDDLTDILYYYPNVTAPKSGIGSNLDAVISIRGFIDNPIINVTLNNLIFAHTAPTYFKSYEVPSGGDWSIHRQGTVFIEGTENLVLHNCTFDSVGGNGVFVSNYNRDTVIAGNEFKYAGDSAIAVVGSAKLIDGTDGNQPRGTKVIGNLAHEFGIWGKQTSFYIQAKACQTELRGNVFFNGPRAGINFNDGFGGGNLLQYNLGFNMVRETGDHGVFNSWDRQPFLTDARTGAPSLIQAQTNITRNFFINNYHSTWPIDHDDGSCYFYDTYNFLVYGGYKNYLGHTKIVELNTYIYPDATHVSGRNGLTTMFQMPYCANSDGSTLGNDATGWGEIWRNNTCVIGNPDIYEFDECDPNHLDGLVPLTANNHFYAPDREVYIVCADMKFSLEGYQEKGYDIGSTVSDIKTINSKTIVQWGRDLLDMEN